MFNNNGKVRGARVRTGAAERLASGAERFRLGLVTGLGRLGGWTAALGSTLVAGVCSQALAGPEGAQVVRGNVSISRTGAETLIRASNNSIINYRSFNIGSNETVRFLQPDAASRVLNRITTAAPTRIDGSLIANGRVYIVNPSGVIFGNGAAVNVAGLYAAAGNITDKAFLSGIDHFTGLSGEVRNEGQINAGFVALLGSRVANLGTIVAPQGTVVMGAGEEALVGERLGNVFVRVGGTAGAGQGAAVENTGDVAARGGQVVMGAGDVYALAVRTTGNIKAAKVTVEGQGAGQVLVSGTIDASNQGAGGKGGEVRVLGEKVGLTGATIDVSGERGGGTALVGGNFQGHGPERNAARTFVSTDSTIKADATRNGNGGKVVVWADEVTRYYGQVSARGGREGGNGGNVEVSGKQDLMFFGGADLGSPKGKLGSLLLDPRDLTVQTVGANDALLNGNIVSFAEPDTATDVTISASAINAINANVTLQAARDMFINEVISMANNGRSLTLQAGNNITVSQSITTRGADISLTANDNGGGTATGTGSIIVNAALDTTGGAQTGGAVNLSLAGGSTGTITIGGNITTANAGITISNNAVVSGTRTLSASTTAGGDKAVTFSGTLDLGSGSLTVSADEIDLAGNVTGPGSLTLQPNAVGQEVRLGGGAGASRLDLTAAELALIQSSVTSLTIGRTDGSGVFGVTGAITLAAPTTLQHGGNITISNAISAGANAITVNAGGNLTLDNAASDITAGSIAFRSGTDGTGNMTFTAAGIDLNADTISLRAGDGAGGGGDAATVAANSANVTYRGSAGGATSPTSFTYRQDAAIADAAIAPAASFAGGITGLNYTLTSDAGSLTLSTAANVAGTNLVLSGSPAILSTTIAPATLTVNSNLTLGGDVNTAGGAIQINGNVTVSGTRGLDTTNAGGTPAGASIGITGTVSATTINVDDFLMNAGTGGNISLGGIVGGSGGASRLNLFQITNANNVTASGAIFANTINQNDGQGLSTFNGILNASNAGALSTDDVIFLNGNAFTLNAGATTTGAGRARFATAGTFTVANTALTLDGEFLKQGVGATSLGANISTTNDNVTFDVGAGTTTLNSATISISAGTGTISLQATNINGKDLSLTANGIDFAGGADSITGTGAGVLSLRPSASGTTIGVGTGAGTLSIDGTDLAALADEAAGQIVIGYSNGNADITVANATFKDAVLIQTPSANAIIVNGPLSGSQADASVTLTATFISLSDTISTSNAAIQINGPLTLAGAGGTLDSAGGNIGITGAVNGTSSGAQSFTLVGGATGDITFGSSVGATIRVGAFEITSAHDVNGTSLRATTVTQVAGAGTTTFTGAVNTNGVDGSGNGVSLTGAAFDLSGGVTTTGTGKVAIDSTGTLTISGVAWSLDGSFDKSGAGATDLGVGITTTNDDITFNAGAGTLTLTAGGVELNSGTGTISLRGTDLNANGLTLSGDEINLLGGADSVGGAGVLTLRSNTNAIVVGGVEGSGSLDISDTDLAAIADRAGTGSIVIGRSNGTTNITIDSTTVRDATTFQTGNANNISVIGDVVGSQSDASLTFAAGTLNLGAALRTTGAGVNLNVSGVTLTADSEIDTTNSGADLAGANISIAAPVNATTSLAQGLTLNAGFGGDINITAAIGQTTRLSQFVITDAHDVSSNSLIRAGAITQTTIANTATYSGQLDASDANASAISLTDGDITLSGGVVTSNGAGVLIDTTGILTISNNTISAVGGFQRQGGGDTNLGADVSGGDISFLGGSGATVTITGATIGLDSATGTTTFNSSLDLGGNALTITGDEISFTAGANTVTGNGASTLTLLSSTVDVAVGGTEGSGLLDISDTDLAAFSDGAFGLLTIGGSTFAHNIQIDSSTFRDAVQFLNDSGSNIAVTGTITGSTSDASVLLSGGSIDLGSNIQTSGAGVQLTGPVTISIGAATIDTTNGGAASTGANITIDNSVDGNIADTNSLQLNAGTGGDILLSGDVGGSLRLDAFQVVNAHDVGTQGIFGVTINQAAGTGTSTFDGILDASGVGGILLQGTNIVVNAGATTSSGSNAAMNVVVSGNLSIQNVGLTLDGAFSKLGAGTVDLGAGITTTNDAISFGGAGAVTIASGTVTLNTGAGAGNVTFNSALGGPGSLLVTAGTGLVAFNDTVGAGKGVLDGLTVATSGGVTVGSSLDATTVSFTSTGNVLVSGAVTAGTFDSAGVDFTLQNTGSLTTTGDVTIAHTGAVLIDGAVDTGSGAFDAQGASVTINNTVSAGGFSLTSTDDLFIGADITAASITTHSGTDGTGNTTFGSGVNLNADAISLRAGDGTGGSTAAFVDVVSNPVAFRGTAGGSTSPTDFTLRQDAAIDDTNTPAASQFAGGIQGLNYTLRSDDAGVTLSDATKVADANLTLTGSTGVTLTTSIAPGSVTVNSLLFIVGDVEISSLPTFFGSGIINLAGGANLGSENLTLTADEVQIGAAMSGTGNLVIQPRNASVGVRLGSSGLSANLDLSLAELAFLSNGFNSITIGRADGTGAITTAAAIDFFDPITLRSAGVGGTINILHTLRGLDNASITILGPCGASFVGADILTNGNAITFSDGITIGADVTIDSTNAGSASAGADITFTCPVDSDAEANNRTLTINAGTGGVIEFGDVVGASQRLGSLSTTSSLVRSTDIGTTGDLSIGSALVLIGDASLTTTGGDIVITGAIDGDGVSDRALTLDAASGDVSVNADVGSTTPLASLTANGANLSFEGVTTTGNQSYTGLLTLGGNVSGQQIAFNSGVVIDSDLTVAGSTFVLFGDFIRSTNGAGRSLTINSPTTTLIGTIGSGAGNELGSLTLDSGGVATIQSGSIAVLGDAVFGDAVTLTNGLTVASTNGSVQFGSTVNSDATPRALSVLGPASGNVLFLDNVGGVSPLASLSVNNVLLINLGGDVSTTGDINLAAPTEFFGNSIFTADNVTFGSAVNSEVGGTPWALRINANGSVSIAGNAGDADAFQQFVINAGAISLRSVTTRGLQTYTGAMSLNGQLNSTVGGTIAINNSLLLLGNSSITTAGAAGDSITLSGTVNSSGTARDLTINAGSGAVVISGLVGHSVIAGQVPVGVLNITGSTISLAGVKTTGNQFYTGATTLSGNVDVTGTGAVAFGGALVLGADVNITTTNGGVTFGSTVDSDTLATRALLVTTGGSGQTLFTGNVGGTNRLSSLTVAADGSTQIQSSSIRATGDVSFDNQVILANSVTIEGNDLTFQGTVNGDGVTGRTLTLNSADITNDTGEVSFFGAVGGTTRLQKVVSSGTGAVRVGADMSTNDGMTFGGAVLVAADSVMDGGTGTLFFRSTINADSSATDPSLTLLSSATSDADTPAFRFGGSIGTTRRLGTFRLGADRSPSAAANAVFSDGFDANGRITAASFSPSDAFVIKAGNGGFAMGRGQKLTTFGSLTIDTPGPVRLGDLTALTTITISNAQSIVLQLRGPGPVQDQRLNGANLTTTNDLGLDIVAQGAIDFNVVPTEEQPVGGNFRHVLFANNGAVRPARLATFSFSDYTFFDGSKGVRVTLFNDLRAGGAGFLLPLDLAALGPTVDGVATSLAGAIPRDTERRESATPVSIGKALRDLLLEMGVATRDLSPDELMEFLVGRSIYQDLPLKAKPAVNRDYIVTINRLSQTTVEDAVKAYREFAKTPLLNPDGTPVVDSNRQPVLTDRTAEIKQAIGDAWDEYLSEVGDPDHADGAAFAAWLGTRGDKATQADKDAKQFLAGALVVFEKIDALGLSPFEASIAKNRLLGDIKPSGMTEDQFHDAVFGKQVSMLEVR